MRVGNTNRIEYEMPIYIFFKQYSRSCNTANCGESREHEKKTAHRANKNWNWSDNTLAFLWVLFGIILFSAMKLVLLFASHNKNIPLMTRKVGFLFWVHMEPASFLCGACIVHFCHMGICETPKIRRWHTHKHTHTRALSPLLFRYAKTSTFKCKLIAFALYDTHRVGLWGFEWISLFHQHQNVQNNPNTKIRATFNKNCVQRSPWIQSC